MSFTSFIQFVDVPTHEADHMLAGIFIQTTASVTSYF